WADSRSDERQLARVERASAKICLPAARQSGAFRWIDENELRATISSGNPITEPAVAQPDRLDPHPRDERQHIVAQETLGSRVVGGGDDGRLLRRGSERSSRDSNQK